MRFIPWYPPGLHERPEPVTAAGGEHHRVKTAKAALTCARMRKE